MRYMHVGAGVGGGGKVPSRHFQKIKFEEKQRNIPNIDIKYLEQTLYI
jgi:hypothetical protein